MPAPTPAPARFQFFKVPRSWRSTVSDPGSKRSKWYLFSKTDLRWYLTFWPNYFKDIL